VAQPMMCQMLQLQLHRMSVRICHKGEQARVAHSRKARAIWRQRFTTVYGTELLALIAGDLFHEINHAPAQLRIFDICERFGQRQPIGGRQKIGDIVGDRSF
jgi:hypothetical protein